MKRQLIETFLRLYPARWRAQYGAELEHVLSRRPLTPRAVFDVAASGAWQQLRLQEPWIVIGVPLAIWAGLVWTILILWGAPVRLRGGSPGGALFSTFVLLATGCWTGLRSGRGAGRAAMKVSLIATLPMFLVGSSS